MEKETETTASNVYEVGYHLVATLAEESIPAEADKVKAIVTKEGGEIISEGAPELKNLAYPVSKATKAYFGWVKFTAAPDAVVKIKAALDASKSVLRHLIVGTVKESTLVADKEKRAPRTSATPAESLDKTIDELVVS